MDLLFTLAIISISTFVVMYIAYWIYKRPRRKMAKKVDDNWENNKL